MADPFPPIGGFPDRAIGNAPGDPRVGPWGRGLFPGTTGMYREWDDQIDPDDPAAPTSIYRLQAEQWPEINLCMGGNAEIRRSAHVLIPQLKKEKDPCYARRLQHVLYSPYLQRIINAAVGLILRKPITLEGGNEEWWGEWRENCDRQGNNLDNFSKNLLSQALAYGHCCCLADNTADTAIQTLGDQYEQGVMPFLTIVHPRQLIGWREDIRSTGSIVQQVRILEETTEPDGKFGVKTIRQVRVLEPGKFEVYRRRTQLVEDDTTLTRGIDPLLDLSGGNTWEVHEADSVDLDRIPLSAVYSGRNGTFLSRPPLRDVAFINLQHTRVQSKLLHALDVAGFPILTLIGWDDTSSSVDADVTSALALPIGGGASYTEPASSAFAATQEELRSLEEQMANLGIAILAQQKMVAETAKAKELDRADTNSLMAVVSMSLEQCLQEQIDLVAEFAGQEAPEVSLDRNFSGQTLEHTLADVTAMFTAGLIDRPLALELLQRGEVLKDGDDLEDVTDRMEQQDLEDMEQEIAKADAMAGVEVAKAHAMPPKVPAAAAGED
jgi:hypothetical protein